ncbi:hypothetical protein T484DRAFT_1757729 [Baffinella frigidus]|nr:hypothetical protein T484DRAFT_1757729 [Cryptophyta sp. CCMP2293]
MNSLNCQFDENRCDGPIPWWPLRFYDTNEKRCMAVAWYMHTLLHICDSNESIHLRSSLYQDPERITYDMVLWCGVGSMIKKMEEFYPDAFITNIKKNHVICEYPIISTQHLRYSEIEFKNEIQACLFFAEASLASLIRYKMCFGGLLVNNTHDSAEFVDPTNALVVVNALRSMLEQPSIVRVMNSPMGFFKSNPLLESSDNTGIKKLLHIEDYQLRDGEIAFAILDEPLFWSTNNDNRNWSENDFDIAKIPVFIPPTTSDDEAYKKFYEWYDVETGCSHTT